MSEASTIYDVASRAGVSITTVSLALNRPGRVADATRARVLAAVDELGFVPKAAAVAHARRGVALIGVIAPFTSYPTYGRRLNGVIGVMRARTSDVVIFDEQSAAASTSPLLATLPIRRRLDGLIVMGLPLGGGAAERLTRQALPTVLVDSTHERFSTVLTDDEAGGYLAGRHLLERGHQRLAFVSEHQFSDAYVSQGARRLDGFRRAAREAGLADSAVRVVRVDNGLAGGRQAADGVLAGRRPVTGVFAHHDALGCGLLQAVRARGVVVPEDLAIVGFDDSDLADFAGLTTVRQPFEESGVVAAEQLLRQIERGPTAPRHTLLGLDLIVRSTT